MESRKMLQMIPSVEQNRDAEVESRSADTARDGDSAANWREEHSKWSMQMGSCLITWACLSERCRMERGGIALSYSRNQHNIVAAVLKNIKSKQKMWYI